MPVRFPSTSVRGWRPRRARSAVSVDRRTSVVARRRPTAGQWRGRRGVTGVRRDGARLHERDPPSQSGDSQCIPDTPDRRRSRPWSRSSARSGGRRRTGRLRSAHAGRSWCRVAPRAGSTHCSPASTQPSPHRGAPDRRRRVDAAQEGRGLPSSRPSVQRPAPGVDGGPAASRWKSLPGARTAAPGRRTSPRRAEGRQAARANRVPPSVLNGEDRVWSLANPGRGGAMVIARGPGRPETLYGRVAVEPTVTLTTAAVVACKRGLLTTRLPLEPAAPRCGRG